MHKQVVELNDFLKSNINTNILAPMVILIEGWGGLDCHQCELLYYVLNIILLHASVTLPVPCRQQDNLIGILKKSVLTNRQSITP